MTKQSVEIKAELIVARGAVEQAILDLEFADRVYGRGGADKVGTNGPVGFPAIEAERRLRDAMARYRSLGGVIA